MAQAVARHLALLGAAIQDHGGVLLRTMADAVPATFPTASDAIDAVKAHPRSAPLSWLYRACPPSRPFLVRRHCGGRHELFSCADQHRTHRLPEHRDARPARFRRDAALLRQPVHLGFGVLPVLLLESRKGATNHEPMRWTEGGKVASLNPGLAPRGIGVHARSSGASPRCPRHATALG